MTLLLLLLTSNPAGTACGDPAAGLAVTGEPLVLRLGEKGRLRLFGNRREGVAYRWTLRARPVGSLADVVQPEGTTVGVTSECEYAYSDGTVPNLTPDVGGDYLAHVEARPMDGGPPAFADVHLRALELPAGETTGCDAFPGISTAALALTLWRRRRARQ